MNKWIYFVKQYAKKNKMTYKQALISPNCKALYNQRTIIKGGKLESIEEEEPELKPEELKNFIKNSYSKELVGDYKDFQIDEELSGRRVQVYYNPITNQSVVVHRGTGSIQDVKHDAELLLLHTNNNNRFKHAKKIQKQAEEKYGTDNLITVGHSLSSQYASKLGKKGKQIITLNGAITPHDVIFNQVPDNQIDYRSYIDPVSILRPLQRGRKAINIAPRGINLLKEHKSSILNRIKK